MRGRQTQNSRAAGWGAGASHANVYLLHSDGGYDYAALTRVGLFGCERAIQLEAEFDFPSRSGQFAHVRMCPRIVVHGREKGFAVGCGLQGQCTKAGDRKTRNRWPRRNAEATRG